MFIISNKVGKYKDIKEGVVQPIRLNNKADYIIKHLPEEGLISFKTLYDSAAGKTAWIIGYGPSWAKLVGREVIGDIFVINRAIKGYPNAKYWAAHDADVLVECLASKQDKTTILTPAGNVYLNVPWPRRGAVLVETDHNPERWLNPSDRPLYYNMTTMGWVIDLVIRMGYSRINILGADDHTTWEYVHPVFDEEELRRQHVGVKLRMLEMFSPAVEKTWRTRPVEIADYSNGSLSDLPNVIRGDIREVLNG